MKLKLIQASLVIMAIGLVAGVASLQAQNHPKGASSKATANRGEPGGKDENIKKDRQSNDPNSKVEAPPDKGGSKTRGDVCRLHIDNRTRWYIDVYTDGEYRGEVSPFGDSTGYVGCGETKFYGKATFNDGSTKVWGPSSYFVDESFTWTLHY